MNETRVLISIIIPTYNYAKLLERAVASVHKQLNKNHELIVIDDGSTDNTQELVSTLKNKYKTGVRYIKKPNGGLASTRNKGIETGRGDYFIFLDADDELAPNALAHIEEHIKKNPDTELIIGGHISISESGKQKKHTPNDLPTSPIHRVRGYLINKTIQISNGACVMHRKIFDYGNYPEQFRSSEDIPVFCQALANCKCTIEKNTIAYIYKHSDSLRHNANYAIAGGKLLVEETFSPNRIGVDFREIKKEFLSQRLLSLFRTTYLAKQPAIAKQFFIEAIKEDWKVIFKISYTKKFLATFL